MGLTICRSIIESHNGRLWAEAGLGQGSVFWISLPARADIATVPADRWSSHDDGITVRQKSRAFFQHHRPKADIRSLGSRVRFRRQSGHRQCPNVGL